MVDRRLATLVALVALALGACSRPADRARTQASPTIPSASRGAALFSQNCAVCHGDRGAGARLGPPLIGIGKRKTQDAIRIAIEHPDPPMPKLYPARLSKQDLNDLTAFVESL
jgi:mono/diheme cytochrome c family protein